MSSTVGSTIQRRRILVQGIVQGVGFRPFVYGQAQRLGLVGFVCNDSQGVTIEIEGEGLALDGFQRALHEQIPPLARIDSMTTEAIPACHEQTFTIIHSQQGTERRALISPDTATCDDCLRELFDPTDRRHAYPFINCTNCGPRFTIVQDVPYDREKTTMRVFPMCPSCQAEYDDPANRRFHAQPNACPTCGPQVRLAAWADERSALLCRDRGKGGEDEGALCLSSSNVDSLFPENLRELYGNEKDRHKAPTHPPIRPLSLQEGSDSITNAARQLASGAILAIKGLGGYHLACDALNWESVQQLRARKHREAKPFALMVPDVETARLLCEVSEAEAALLASHRRPIVLLSRLATSPVAAAVAPGCHTLGVLLPYTPLHHLLLRAFAGAIEAGRPAVLVMTSGNLSDEPIAYRDDDARTRLFPVAIGMLTHNREIHMRCDDSVVRIVAGGKQLFRRSRGYAPEPVPLAQALPLPLLACGGHLKNTFCLGKDRRAFLSHHIGDLENLETLTSFREGITHFQRLFDIYPEAIAYDLHPEYLATKYALDSPIPLKIGVQHHHAHIASVLAEHGLDGPVIGVAADGTGYGTDGAVWGCEVMVADLTAFDRLAHLAYISLPGGEQAVRQPWRVAAAYLAQAFGDDFLAVDIPFVQRLDRAKWRALAQMMARNINSPATSSLGRLFDAVAALLGLRDEVLYEGQAAVELETLAQAGQQELAQEDAASPYPFVLEEQGVWGQRVPALLDVRPTIRAIVVDIQQGVAAHEIALRFHGTVAELLATACLNTRERTGLDVVALSGGVFQNRVLLEYILKRLKAMSFQVYINRRVPPNDGGLALGQLVIAAARLRNM